MAKLNVLVVAYYFPPAKAVAGQRVYSWCKYFPKDKINSVFVTRKWSGTESSWNDLTKNAAGTIEEEVLHGNKIFRLPSTSITDKRIFKNVLFRIKFLEKIARFLLNYYGYFNIETDAHISFKKFLLNYLKKNKIDLIIVSSPPLNLVRLAHELNKKTGIPYHLDFRDLWSNEYLQENYIPDSSRAVIDQLKEKFLERWMKNALSVTIDSQAKADILRRVYNGKIDIITNGFDPELYTQENTEKFPEFTITLSGTYYPQQPLSIFLEGINLFLKNNDPQDFKIVLVGLEVAGNAMEQIKSWIDNRFLKILDRKTVKENAEILSRSHVSFLPSWYGYKGLYTTKLFDMLASGSKVLIAPGDHDVIDDTMKKTKAGEVVYTAEDFFKYLNQWYNEWRQNGFVSHSPDKNEINKFSRKEAAVTFVNLILEKGNTSVNQ